MLKKHFHTYGCYLSISVFLSFIFLSACHNDYTADVGVNPTAINVSVSSPLESGKLASASYQYRDYGSPEGASLYQWFINGIEVGDQLSYFLPIDSEEKTLVFCVTPIALFGKNKQGKQTCTQGATIAAKEGVAPQALNLRWDDFAKANVELTLGYDYIDSDGDAEGASIYQWLLDGVEVSQSPQYTLPSDSAGKPLTLCVTPLASTGLPKVGEKVCLSKDVAAVFVTGELKLKETLLLDIKGYTVEEVTWTIKHPVWAPVRSNSETSFTIEGAYSTEEATNLVGVELELCITSLEEGQMCLPISEFPISAVTGGLPVELDADNNVVKRVISPIDYVDLTIGGITKRLHRPLTVVESILT